MTVPGHPRTSEKLVRTKLSALNLSASQGTDDRPGHPRTSRMLVRTLISPLQLEEQSPPLRLLVPARSHSWHLALTLALKLR